MLTFLYVLLAVLVFGVLIMIHELGHFLVARACGVGIREFSIGMGPKLLSWKGKKRWAQAPEGEEKTENAAPVALSFDKIERGEAESAEPEEPVTVYSLRAQLHFTFLIKVISSHPSIKTFWRQLIFISSRSWSVSALLDSLFC